MNDTVLLFAITTEQISVGDLVSVFKSRGNTFIRRARNNDVPITQDDNLVTSKKRIILMKKETKKSVPAKKMPMKPMKKGKC